MLEKQFIVTYKNPYVCDLWRLIMKKTGLLLLLFLLSACSGSQNVYPYGLTEQEWNSLSIRDQTRLRRDFYFYEKGSTAYVNPHLEVEGKDAGAGNAYVSQSNRRENADYSY